MIEHVKEIFLIPDDLLKDIENQKTNNLAQVIKPATPATRKVIIELETSESFTMGKIVSLCLRNRVQSFKKIIFNLGIISSQILSVLIVVFVSEVLKLICK